MSISKTVYQMKVTLVGSKPLIWRRFLVEDTIMLGKLHDILQIVMGWTNSHLHHFFINGEYYGMRMDDEFGAMRTKDETFFKLNQFISGKGFSFRYEYDFGDSWLHDMIIEKILPAEEGVYYPVCVAGKRACPPEDVGGIWGYLDFLTYPIQTIPNTMSFWNRLVEALTLRGCLKTPRDERGDEGLNGSSPHR